MSISEKVPPPSPSPQTDTEAAKRIEAPSTKLLRRPFRYDPLLSIGFVIFLLALWQLAVTAKWLDERLWPGPITVFGEMWDMLKDGTLQPHIGATFGRVLWAFGLGSIAGIGLGLAMGLSRPLRAMFDPLISTLSVLPKIAILPLVYLAFGGYGEVPRTVTVGIGVFAVMAISAMGAVRTIDGVLIEAGRNFGARWWQMFRHVVLPGALPSILSGLRIGAATALLVVIAAEFSYTNEGLGFLIWSSWSTLSTTRMFVGLICIALMGVIFTLLLNLADRLFIPWKANN